MANTKRNTKVKPKSGSMVWLKEHMIHIMVLANGIILTMATFWTVNLFVGQVLKDDYFQAGLNTRQIVNEKFADFQNSLLDFGTYFQSAYVNSNGMLVDNTNSGNVNTRLLDLLLWIPIDNPNSVVDLKARNVVQPVARQAFNIGLATDILTLAKNSPDVFLYMGKNINILSQNGGTVLQARPFAVVKTIKESGGKIAGYLAGFSSLDKILSLEQITSGKYVSKTVFWDDGARVVLFAISNPDQSDISFGQQYKYDFTAPLGGKIVHAQVTYQKDNKNMLLEVLPFLIGGFGLIVTLIGWFYVSENHKKSKTLSNVNTELGQKNDELNDQIREREKLFQTLRKSERENYAIINAISDIIFEVSPTGEILFLNEAWTKITGFDLKTSMGTNLFEMIYPADQEEQASHIASLAKGHKTAYRDLTKLRTIEGTFRSVEIVVSMLRQDDAKNLRVVGSFTDIEERQRAEHALSEVEKKYKTIWQNAAGGIYQIDSQGHFLSANPALAKIFGFDTSDQLIKAVKNAHDDLFVNYQARAHALKTSAEQPNEPVFIESEALRSDGVIIWVRENFRAVFDDSSNFLYYEGSIEDITPQKESEVQLKEAKVQSDMANRAKSEFLANISHELRTPLNSIIGFSEIIRNEVFGVIEPPSYKEYAANIYDSGKHLLSIINQILDISRIDAGERELNESLVDVRKIATLCLDMTRSKITQASLTIVDMIPDNLPRLIAEEVAVKQMLLNLLSNAAKFTANGGRITLSAEMDVSGRMRISVTDTGVGLSADQIEKSVKPFGLVDGRLDKGTGGAGLGLSLVHSLLRLHGGKLEILSQKGIGTTASLIFPADRIQA